MSNFKIEEVLRNAVNDNRIKSSHLKHLPQLKTCDNWGQATFLGRVSFKFQYSNYEGGLVKLNGKLYYINQKQIQAVSTFVKWNTAHYIEVINDGD
ncbi:MAG TPA: hypothetical protein PK771_05000 [Spirochaetota bacterium]|nr:hypothetical protein [Spirochaetota bacterium]